MRVRPYVSRTFSLLTALVLVIPLYGGTASAQEMQEKSLYQRLGGYDAIAAVTDDFIGRLAADEELGRFLIGLSTDSKLRLRQLVVDQICEVAGGPCIYTGRDMKTAHAGLGITEAEWDRAVQHLVDTLDKFMVPEREKNELLAAVSTLKDDIVEEM